MSQTGWKAAREARRPHTAQELRRNPPKVRASRQRRIQAKNRRAAMGARGLAP